MVYDNDWHMTDSNIQSKDIFEAKKIKKDVYDMVKKNGIFLIVWTC